MKKLLLLVLILFKYANAQVPLYTIAEHFTNTECSVCANRNPGFYSNVRAQSNVNYVSIHPSSPYSTCLLSQQNTVANDARTRFYSLYGSTPKIVINGTAISASLNYASASLFTPYVNLYSDFEINGSVSHPTADSIVSRFVIKRVSTTSSFTSAKLYSGLVEDTVFYTGGNGETRHYNVLRKAFTAAAGDAVLLPALVGDSIVFEYRSKVDSFINSQRLKSLIILQDATTRQVIQSFISSTANAMVSGITNLPAIDRMYVYPNPAKNFITVKKNGKAWSSASFNIRNLTGAVVASGQLDAAGQTDLTAFPDGIYIIECMDHGKSEFARIILTK